VSYDTLGRGRVEVEFSRIDDVAEEDMVAFDDHDGDDDDRGDNDSGSNPDAEVDDES
jgi:ribosome maturation factor RimP